MKSRDINIVIPTDIELVTLFNHADFGKGSKLEINRINLEGTGKFRLFSSSIMKEDSKVKIKDFNMSDGMEIISNENLTMERGAKIKISTSREAIFHKLKSAYETESTIKISLKK